MNGLRSLTIGWNSLNFISSFPFLITLTMGSSSLNSVEELSVMNLPNIESITIHPMTVMNVYEVGLVGVNGQSSLSIGAKSLR